MSYKTIFTIISILFFFTISCKKKQIIPDNEDKEDEQEVIVPGLESFIGDPYDKKKAVLPPIKIRRISVTIQSQDLFKYMVVIQLYISFKN